MQKLWRWRKSGVAIYRQYGEFRRAKSYCHLYGAQGQRHACHDEFRGSRSDYARQLLNQQYPRKKSNPHDGHCHPIPYHIKICLPLSLKASRKNRNKATGSGKTGGSPHSSIWHSNPGDSDLRLGNT
ncbi:hypothetical protein TNCV_1480661 [Trichonephila clavipes]|nr:hypothetical protein TNCV_1480661 [Trichonephila clavipes]